MNLKPPNSRRNLDIAIDRVLRDSGNPLQIRTAIANTIIGQMLPEGAVKGGSALKLRYGNKSTRFSRDLDTSRAEDLSEYLQKLDYSLSAGWCGFTGRIIRKEPPQPKGVPNEYIMQPFEIKLSYLDRSWLTVPLEIGHDEIGDTKNPDVVISDDIIEIFSRLGFTAPQPVALMSVHHQIAQKLHAASELGSHRAHDLIDLQIIAQNEKLDLQLIRKTCVRLFSSRKMQSWPPVIIKGDDWESLYNAQITGLSVLRTAEEAVTWTNEFIINIDRSRQQDRGDER